MSETANRPVRIMLIDDHALFRESVARLLAAEPAMEIVAACSTTEEAASILKNNAVDLVLLDFDLGDRDCSEFVRASANDGFHGKILLVTAGVPETQAGELIRRGISGIFMKHDEPELLSQAIHEVMSGKVWFSQRFLQSTLAAASAQPSAPQVIDLTERERQVLTRIFEGLANKEIAEQLGVSESSVKATLQQLFSKTGVRTRSQLVRVALEQYKELL
jgi:DNA-binding NarL/FixJ family response regulator